jgi:hypothetical protein
MGATIVHARRPRRVKPIDLRSNEQREEPQQNEQRDAVASICVAGATA